MKRLHLWLLVIAFAGTLAACQTQPQGDEADLRLVPGLGVVFSAGPDRPALGVTISIIGDELDAPPTRDARSGFDITLRIQDCLPDGPGYRCDVGDVEAGAEAVVRVSGRGVTATAAYRRPGSSRVLIEAAHP